MIAVIALTSVSAFVTPLSAGAANESKAAVATPHTARVGNASTAAVKTAPIVGAAGWHIQTVDNSSNDVGFWTSIQLTTTGWPAVSYYDMTNSVLKSAYKDTLGWHTQVVDNGGDVGNYGTSLPLTLNWLACDQLL